MIISRKFQKKLQQKKEGDSPFHPVKEPEAVFIELDSDPKLTYRVAVLTTSLLEWWAQNPYPVKRQNPEDTSTRQRCFWQLDFFFLSSSLF